MAGIEWRRRAPTAAEVEARALAVSTPPRASAPCPWVVRWVHDPSGRPALLGVVWLYVCDGEARAFDSYDREGEAYDPLEAGGTYLEWCPVDPWTVELLPWPEGGG